MNFAFSEEQDELRKSVRRFLEDKSPETEVRRLMETTEGYDPAVWTQMAEQLGLQSLTIPEEFGGSGFSYVELIVVLEEMGAALLCAPFFSTVALAANALLDLGRREGQGVPAAGHRLRRDHRHPGLHRGLRPLGRRRHHAGGRPVGRRLERSTATRSFVLDGHVADLVLVVGRTTAGLSASSGSRATPTA